MEDSSDASNIYAPPGSRPAITLGAVPSLRWRFLLTCLAFALAAPPAFFAGTRVAPIWLETLVALAIWPIAVWWILLPYLRHRDHFEALDVTYIACVAIGFPVCTALIYLGLVLVMLATIFVVYMVR